MLKTLSFEEKVFNSAERLFIYLCIYQTVILAKMRSIVSSYLCPFLTFGRNHSVFYSLELSESKFFIDAFDGIEDFFLFLDSYCFSLKLVTFFQMLFLHPLGCLFLLSLVGFTADWQRGSSLMD